MSTQSERTKRYRARQRAGLAVLKVSVSELDFAALLIEGGWLTEDEALQRKNLEHVATRIIAEWAAARKKRAL